MNRAIKQLLTLSLALAVTVPVLAAPKARTFKSHTSVKARQLPADAGRMKRLMAQYEAAVQGVGASALTDIRSTRLLLFPAAGNARGAGGEFFRSDVTLVNYHEFEDQVVVVIWLQNGVDTETPPAIEMTLEPNSYYYFTDFVGTILNRQNQLGSIFIVPIDSLGDIEVADSALDGYSRIWTNQPNATGTVAQPFEATDPYEMFPFLTASIMGLRHDAQYRSNYGLVNIDDIPHVFTVKFLGEGADAETTVTIPAGGMIHAAVPAGNYGPLVIEVTVDDEVAPWVAYGTSNDNITGDGWVSIGSGILTPADLDDVDGGQQE
jgi:hypothetical protein